MGIKSVNAILKKHAPGAFQLLPLVRLHGYRIAIDGSIWVYSRSSAAQSDVIYKMADPLLPVDREAVTQIVKEMLISFLIKLCEFGITVVWCWDGAPLPDKKACKEERAADKAETARQVDELRVELEATHPLARTPEQIKRFKGKLAQQSHVAFEEMKYFRDLIELLGFPSIQADHEAEKLCANLAREGLVAGVWSTDTDNYPLGTPMMITGFEGLDADRQPQVSVVYLPIILAGLGLTHEQFVDLCIMLGTDFNKNMPNKGEKRCWDLLQKYKSIDAMATAEPKLPVHVLKHMRGREIFAAQPTGLTNESPSLAFNDTKFRTYSRDVTMQYDVSHQYAALVTAVRRIPPPKVVSFTKVASHTASEKHVALLTDAFSEEKKSSRRLTVVREPPATEPIRRSRLDITRAPVLPTLPLPIEV